MKYLDSPRTQLKSRGFGGPGKAKSYLSTRLKSMIFWGYNKYIPAQISSQSTKKTETQFFYNQKPFSYWFAKNNYYHKRVINFYTRIIPQQSRVLHVNCKNGYALQALNPSYAVGVDSDYCAFEQARTTYPDYHFFCGQINEVPGVEPVDYIILSFITMEADDIQLFLQDLQRFCHSGTRIIVDTYSYVWEPVLWITTKLGLRRPTYYKNWVSAYALAQFLHVAGFELVTKGSYLLFPFYIPGISWFLNNCLAHVPLFNRLCLHQWFVARSLQKKDKTENVNVSIIIPCRNERGNIQAAVERCPQLGNATELIFVEGHSTDGTLEEIKKIAYHYPQKAISWYVQQGKGKADAARLGFAKATGDIVMILDADLTMPPEELAKFFDALIANKGECINGSRLVYGMEHNAMGFLSWISNYFFGYLLSWIMGQRVTDTLCGTKVLWKKNYERIEQQRGIFGLQDPFGDFDLLFGSANVHLKIIDIPVHYKQRTYGKTNISRFRDVWFLLWISWRAFFKLRIR